MLFDDSALRLKRCPHCGVAHPLLGAVHAFQSADSLNHARYKWRVYVCSKCGKPVTAGCAFSAAEISFIFPAPESLGSGIPERALAYLSQAIESVHAPSGAVMLCASSVDAMLKEKGLKTGSLYTRIKEAVDNHLITKEMSEWAHEVRLDANDERHADETAALPTESDAGKAILFAKAFAEFLFVLPARIDRGRKGAI